MAKFTRSSRRSCQLNGLLAFDHHKWCEPNFYQLLSKCLGGVVLNLALPHFKRPLLSDWHAHVYFDLVFANGAYY